MSQKKIAHQQPETTGPVISGSPLYYLLQQVARAVAQRLQSNNDAAVLPKPNKGKPKRRP